MLLHLYGESGDIIHLPLFNIFNIFFVATELANGADTDVEDEDCSLLLRISKRFCAVVIFLTEALLCTLLRRR